jgi:hypothetical protein
MHRPPPPCLFVEGGFAAPRGRGDPPSDRPHRGLITIPWGISLPTRMAVVGRSNPRPARAFLTSSPRAKPLRSIGLPCSSCCVAPPLDGGGRHRRGIPHFLRRVACLEGRVLAGSQIRTALLSQWVPRRHCGARPREAEDGALHAAGHSGARAEHKTNTAVVSRMVR